MFFAKLSSGKGGLRALCSAAPEVLFSSEGHVRHAVLNRPRALNALNLSMIRALTPKVKAWSMSRHTGLIVLSGAGERAFCAGGDVRALYDGGLAEGTDGARTDTPSATGTMSTEEFFREEYALDYLLATSPTPTLAVMDGHTMGGGLGLTFNSHHRVVTDRTVLAMPETGIGLFPDVGGSYFLPRIPATGLGMYLALTGHRLKGSDALCVGTHYVPHQLLPAMLSTLADEVPAGGGRDAEERVGSIIDLFAEVPETEFSLNPFLPEIAAVFGPATDPATARTDSLAALLGRLESSGTPFAQRTLDTLRRMSPTSLCVTYHQMQMGATLDLGGCFSMEYRLARRFMAGARDHLAARQGKTEIERPADGTPWFSGDFFEGVRALLVDKDGSPTWRPGTVPEVSPSDVEAYFAPFGTPAEEFSVPERIEKDAVEDTEADVREAEAAAVERERREENSSARGRRR